MTTILAIDPGPEQSAFVILKDGNPRAFYIHPNQEMLERVDLWCHQLIPMEAVVIEKVESFGMAVGKEVFETVFWSGRFAQAASPVPVDRIGRKAIKLHLCGTTQAKDTNIRQALIDRYGGAAAIGNKKQPGPLYGIHKDVWSALAIAVTWSDLHGRTNE